MHNNQNKPTKGPLYVGSFQPDDRLICIEEVIEIVGLSRSTIYRLMADKTAERPFPRPIAIGKKARAWIEREVYAYLSWLIVKRQRETGHE